ncbi:MAG: hypothetical protein ACI9DO_000337 [Reinekea sp.]|jgi:hypothetical protein
MAWQMAGYLISMALLKENIAEPSPIKGVRARTLNWYLIILNLSIN